MKFKQLLSSLLIVFITLSCFSFAPSALYATEEWEEYYSAYMNDGYGVLLQPGSNESERNISWYAPLKCGECSVHLSENEDFAVFTTFTGKTILTPDGDRRCRVKITGLEEGKTYFYKCVTSISQTPVYSFKTSVGTDFEALYLTDIHVSREQDEMENSLLHQSYTVDRVVSEAAEKSDINLLISAGDQASYGRRAEYESLVASPLLKSISFATCIGNHDRKCIDYKYFTFTPNRNTFGINSFNGGDYWYVKGDVLFMVIDSNCKAAATHRRFVKNAVEANKDVKWRVITCHHDLYGRLTEGRLEDSNENIRPVIIPIVDEFEIDLVFLGHSHYYSMSNGLVGGEITDDLTGKSSVTDAKGTVYMVSGSVNRPKTIESILSVEPQPQCAYTYVTDEVIYNIISFSENSIDINSFTLGSEEPFHSFTINKTTNEGGHNGVTPSVGTKIKQLFFEFIAMFEEFGVRIGKTWDKYFD